MESSTTTIIFVPGAWHSADCFDTVISLLENHGYATDKVYLPSVGPPQHLLDLAPNVAEIRSHILRAVDEGQKVVLVAHSFGGIPSSEAINGLVYATRQEEKQKGGVVHLFLCCSFIIPEGASLMSAFGSNDLPWFDVSEDRLEVKAATPEKNFYNDMLDEDVRKAVAQLKPHSYQPFHSKVKYAGWKAVPTTYLYCLKDAAIPMFVQKVMAEETAKGYGIRTQTVDASHSPFYTVPDEVAEAIRKAAEE